MSPAGIIRNTALLSYFFIAFPLISKAQTTYTQLWNEVDIVRAFNDKWSAELNLAGTFSSTPSEPRALKTNIQRNITGWAHYQISPRWKLSSFLAYYYNKDIPEIGQYEAPEWRFAVQGKYYFNKIGFTLNTDMRFEFRLLANEEGVFEDIYRYRQKLKFLKPLNSQMLRQGVVFVFASEEIIFRSKAKEDGMAYFDRNLFTIGAGYLFTDDIQLELSYVNEFVPRDDGNIINNAVSITLIFNNLLMKLGNLIAGEPETPARDE